MEVKTGNYMKPVDELQTKSILELLEYDVETGYFTWKTTRGCRKAGSLAGSVDGHGYICIQVNGRPHRAHNIAWLFISGDWPKHCVDHINRNRTDNRGINLRDVSFVDNLGNSPRSKGGKIDTIQIGGDHYKKVGYQHWNMVCDTDLPYILGCATKYISRWENKNGLEDLKKSIHYLEKANSDLILPDDNPEYYRYYKLFLTQFSKPEQEILELIWVCEYEQAIKLINELIEEVECGPTSNYVRG